MRPVTLEIITPGTFQPSTPGEADEATAHWCVVHPRTETDSILHIALAGVEWRLYGDSPLDEFSALEIDAEVILDTPDGQVSVKTPSVYVILSRSGDTPSPFVLRDLGEPPEMNPSAQVEMGICPTDPPPEGFLLGGLVVAGAVVAAVYVWRKKENDENGRSPEYSEAPNSSS